jgi:peptidoglycan/LPS O-acetylase OafA/YrhL
MIDQIGLAAFCAIGIAVLCSTVLMYCWPALYQLILADDKSRLLSLDGLRGLIALSVVTNHSVLRYLTYTTDVPGAPEALFLTTPHIPSVSLFFLMSAFAFGGSLLRSDGKLSLLKFYEGRIVRIIPLYLIMVGIAVLFAFATTDFRLIVSPEKLAKSIARLLTFNFVEIYDVNTADVKNQIGQIWTLQYEWIFYALIPVFAYGMRRTKAVWPLYAGLLVCTIYSQLFFFFLAGAAAARLVNVDSVRARKIWQWTGAAGLIAAIFGSHANPGWQQACLLTPFFVAVLQGDRWYGLLGARPLRFLGKISFGIYLLHGFTLWIVSHQLVGVENFRGQSIQEATFVFALNGILAAGVGIVAYLLVERPLMQWRPLTTRLVPVQRVPNAHRITR